ncbi:MAG: hypothetical protein AB7F19_03655 [Candidatus Babeliales bacterium]
MKKLLLISLLLTNLASAMELEQLPLAPCFHPQRPPTFRELFNNPKEQEKALAAKCRPLIRKACLHGCISSGAGIIAIHSLLTYLGENTSYAPLLACVMASGAAVISANRCIKSYSKAIQIKKEDIFESPRLTLSLLGRLDSTIDPLYDESNLYFYRLKKAQQRSTRSCNLFGIFSFFYKKR